MMDLFIGALIAGISVGLIFGLLGFSIVILHKFTGVANFAQGSLATVCTFIVYGLTHDLGLGFRTALIVTVPISAALGAVVYTVFFRPGSGANRLNITMRTLGVYLLLAAVLDLVWSEGQPFTFPSLFSQRSIMQIGSAGVSSLTIGTLAIAAVMAIAFVIFFRNSPYGLLFRAMAERPDTARLLGVRTQTLTCIAWVIATLVALPVGVLVAPAALLSTDMMDRFLLLAFAAAIIGGLDSLIGAYVGGLIVGLIYGVVSVYHGADTSLLVVFAVLLAALLVKPDGLFGSTVRERL